MHLTFWIRMPLHYIQISQQRPFPDPNAGWKVREIEPWFVVIFRVIFGCLRCFIGRKLYSYT